MKAPASIGFYYSAAGRARYLDLYEQVGRFAPAPAQTMDVPTGFGRVRVYRHGPMQAAPVVLLPGGWATAVSWGPNIAGLSERHCVYSVDVLGQPGLSAQEHPVRTGADCASWLGEVLTALEPDRATHLVGTSYGGWLAFNQARRTPDRVASLTLVEPANTLARFSPRFIGGALSQAPGLPRTLTERFYRWALGGPPLDPFRHLMVKLLVRGISEYHPNVAIPTFPRDALLRSVRVPTLALLGGRSGVHDVTRAERRARDLLPHSEVRVWPGATHGLPAEEPVEVNAAIAGFIDRHLTPATAAE